MSTTVVSRSPTPNHAGQATPVIVRVQIPTIKVPPPTVVYAHENFWSTWFIPSVAVVLSGIAALFAYLSYKAILKQIDLARDQLDLANKQVDLAMKEIDLVGQDLAITTRQANIADAERARQPSLSLVIDDVKLGSDSSDHSGKTNVVVSFRCLNSGDKAATAVTAFIYVPSTFDDRDKYMDVLSRVTRQINPPANLLAFDGVEESLPGYKAASTDLSDPIVPGLNAYLGYYDTYVEPGTYKLRWF